MVSDSSTTISKNITKYDIINAFGKYGYIEQIHIVRSRKGVSFVNIAYLTADAVTKAVKDSRKVKVLGEAVTVGRKAKFYFDRKAMEQRTVHISNIKYGTTEEQLKQHFQPFAKKIVKFKLMQSESKKASPYAFVVLKNTESVADVMELHDSLLNGLNIKLSHNHKKILTRQCYEDLTVVLVNKQALSGIEIAKLKSIFSVCGEIQYIDVIAKKHLLAFITFKTAEAAKRALEMSGQTQQELELQLELYSPMKDLTVIKILNLNKTCTEEDIQNHFAQVGEIAKIVLRPSDAVVRFKDSKAYCKAFLYNESFLKGRLIFIEPFSKYKNLIYESANSRTKRKFQRLY